MNGARPGSPGSQPAGTDGQVRDEHLGLGVAQCLGHVYRLGGRLLDDVAVVLVEAVHRRTALDGDTQGGDVSELDRIVHAAVDRLAQVAADLGAVDVERGDEVDLADVVAAQYDVHEAGHVVARFRVLVIGDTLNEGACAVSDARDGHANLLHGSPFLLRFSGEGLLITTFGG